MSGHRDSTAGKAIARADKSGRIFHAPRCVVDGGTRRHGRGRFVCPKCALLAEERKYT